MSIASNFDGNKFIGRIIIKHKPSFNMFKNFYLNFFTCNKFDKVEKKRVFF